MNGSAALTGFFLLAALFAFLVVILRPRKENERDGIGAGDPGPWVLFGVSAAGLYIELLLIRWIGTEVRIFAFVQNLVLIACFLGFGVGCFQSKKPGSLLQGLDALGLLALIVCLPVPQWRLFLLHLSNLMTLSPDSAVWTDSTGGHTMPLWLGVAMVTGMLWLIATSMIPFGRWIGHCFDKAKGSTVRTYTVNLAGSLAGTWILAVLAVCYLSPVWWVALAFALTLAIMPKTPANWVTGLVLMVPVLVVIQAAPQDRVSHGNSQQVSVVEDGFQKGVYWSPYQKLEYVPFGNDDEALLMVNNSGYMTMANSSPAFLNKHPDIKAHYKDSVYDSPFRFVKPGADVMIVGAGAGNDASAALRNGASHVDAVEIDPLIYELGGRLHPDHSYDSPKVTVIVNDARNYLRRSEKKYDAIIFGLLDSHTESSGYTNMRVDNYVYTREAFEQARRLLNPDGVLILKFEVRSPWEWIGQRFFRTLSEIFGRDPVTYYAASVGSFWSGTVFVELDGKKLWETAKKPEVAAFIAKHPPAFALDAKAAPEPSTDDWPYPYNRYRSIPRTYMTVSLILLLLSYAMVRKNFVWKERETWTMFLLGAGFMLMETQLVCRLTLYFGTTWIVNSIAVSTVLVVLMLANVFLEKRGKMPRLMPFFAALVASIFINYLFPWERLPFSPWLTGALLSLAFAVTIFMAGVIFTVSLAGAEKKSQSLGANVIGAVAGGLSQNLSFIIGLKALLPVAALCYAAAAVTIRKRK